MERTSKIPISCNIANNTHKPQSAEKKKGSQNIPTAFSRKARSRSRSTPTKSAPPDPDNSSATGDMDTNNSHQDQQDLKSPEYDQTIKSQNNLHQNYFINCNSRDSENKNNCDPFKPIGNSKSNVNYSDMTPCRQDMESNDRNGNFRHSVVPTSSVQPIRKSAMHVNDRQNWSVGNSTYKSPKWASSNHSNSYSTQEELDLILSKYNSNLNLDKRYVAYLRNPESSNTTMTQGPDWKKGAEKDAYGVFGIPLNTVPRETYGICRRYKFPFRESPDGNLLIYPNQVAFENSSVSVLVSDSSKLDTVQCHQHEIQEYILQGVENILQSGGSNLLKNSEFSTGETRCNSLDLDELYKHKEVINIKYSEAKQGSERFLTEVHSRLKHGRKPDTHVIIGDKVYPCHSLALECVSKFFDNLYKPKEAVRRIELSEEDVPSSVFPALMNWILENEQGRQSALTKRNVVSLYAAAKYLDITELKSQCINFLQEKLETNDKFLMSLWEEVKQNPNCHELMVVVSSKAALSFHNIFREKKFLNLDVKEIIMLLSSEELVADSEYDVFETAVQWLLYNWESRKLFTNDVMRTVRFGLLSPLQLTNICHTPEISKKVSLPHEYHELLQYGSVKSMIDEALAYAVVKESYKSEPEALRRWLDSTGVKAPKPRSNEPGIHNKGKPSPNASKAFNLERRPSYTIFKNENFSEESPCLGSRKQLTGDLRHSRSRSRQGSRHVALEQAMSSIGKPIRDEDLHNFTPMRSRSPSTERGEI